MKDLRGKGSTIVTIVIPIFFFILAISYWSGSKMALESTEADTISSSNYEIQSSETKIVTELEIGDWAEELPSEHMRSDQEASILEN